MKHGKLKKIAAYCQITPQHLSDILGRRKKPSANLAVTLEKCTSVSRTLWIWGSREELRANLENAYRDKDSGANRQEDVK